MPDIRIGVFICHCGKNIGGIVNVPEVAEYARSLPNVVYVEENLYTCSEEGTSSIKARIPEHNLNRAVVASCTPRTHERLFRNTCEAAGLNRYLLEFVNIRDQCSWVHMRQPEKATEKAKDVIRMGVARAHLLEPLEEKELAVIPTSLVIGGGIAGMSAALNLANQGFEVHLVEKEKELGGLVSHLNKLFTDNREAAELVANVADRVQNHPQITCHLPAQVTDVSGFVGDFKVILKEGEEEKELPVGTIIIATGAREFQPAGQYGYRQNPGVMTQLELEERMQKGTVTRQNIVIINCVGARVPERSYCGRFCCMTAIKNALLIKENNPEAKIWILHRDLMTYGTEYESYYRTAMQKGIRFVRYSLDDPPQIIGDGKVDKVSVYHQLLGRQIELPCDTVVLTTPLVPNEDNQVISRMLKIPLSQEGFFLEAHVKLQPVEFATDGIYVCGAARWPTDVPEAITQGYASAAKAGAPMRRGFVKPEAITALVDEDKCAGCQLCARICPFQAIEMQTGNGRTVARVTIAQCKGCGLCSAACPSSAIDINHFKDEQILAQIGALI